MLDISRNTGVQIWRNGRIPVVYRPGRREYLLARIPFTGESILWLAGEGKHRIEFNPRFKAWEIPPTRLNDIIKRCLNRFGETWLIQSYREFEKCAPACWNAEGFDCQCSCLGENHGSGRELEHIVSETFAFEWGGRRLSARHFKAR